MKIQIERARMYYDRVLRGVPMLSPESRLPVQSSLGCYGKILDKIEENGYDSLTKRAYVSKQEKLLTIPLSWYRTQDISKIHSLETASNKINEAMSIYFLKGQLLHFEGTIGPMRLVRQLLSSRYL